MSNFQLFALISIIIYLYIILIGINIKKNADIDDELDTGNKKNTGVRYCSLLFIITLLSAIKI